MADTKTILLIDDNPDDAEHYTALLKECSMPFLVLNADSGADGIALFQKHKVDCAIIDYNLPKMDGLEILDTIVKSSNRYVATIILTGEPHKEIRVEAARKGALDYMVKENNTSAVKLEEMIVKTINWAELLNKKV